MESDSKISVVHGISVQTTITISAKCPDGTEVQTVLTYPPDASNTRIIEELKNFRNIEEFQSVDTEKSQPSFPEKDGQGSEQHIETSVQEESESTPTEDIEATEENEEEAIATEDIEASTEKEEESAAAEDIEASAEDEEEPTDTGDIEAKKEDSMSGEYFEALTGDEEEPAAAEDIETSSDKEVEPIAAEDIEASAEEKGEEADVDDNETNDQEEKEPTDAVDIEATEEEEEKGADVIEISDQREEEEPTATDEEVSGQEDTEPTKVDDNEAGEQDEVETVAADVIDTSAQEEAKRTVDDVIGAIPSTETSRSEEHWSPSNLNLTNEKEVNSSGGGIEVEPAVETPPIDIELPFETPPNDIESLVETLPDETESPVENLPDETESPVENLTDEIESSVENIPDEIESPVENLPDEIESSVENIPDGIESPVENLPDEIESAVETLPDPLSESSSPSDPQETESVEGVISPPCKCRGAGNIKYQQRLSKAPETVEKDKGEITNQQKTEGESNVSVSSRAVGSVQTDIHFDSPLQASLEGTAGATEDQQQEQDNSNSICAPCNESALLDDSTSKVKSSGSATHWSPSNLNFDGEEKPQAGELQLTKNDSEMTPNSEITIQFQIEIGNHICVKLDKQIGGKSAPQLSINGPDVPCTSIPQHTPEIKSVNTVTLTPEEMGNLVKVTTYDKSGYMVPLSITVTYAHDRQLQGNVVPITINFQPIISTMDSKISPPQSPTVDSSPKVEPLTSDQRPEDEQLFPKEPVKTPVGPTPSTSWPAVTSGELLTSTMDPVAVDDAEVNVSVTPSGGEGTATIAWTGPPPKGVDVEMEGSILPELEIAIDTCEMKDREESVYDSADDVVEEPDGGEEESPTNLKPILPPEMCEPMWDYSLRARASEVEPQLIPCEEEDIALSEVPVTFVLEEYWFPSNLNLGPDAQIAPPENTEPVEETLQSVGMADNSELVEEALESEELAETPEPIEETLESEELAETPEPIEETLESEEMSENPEPIEEAEESGEMADTPEPTEEALESEDMEENAEPAEEVLESEDNAEIPENVDEELESPEIMAESSSAEETLDTEVQTEIALGPLLESDSISSFHEQQENINKISSSETCEPMWDYSLRATASQVDPQVICPEKSDTDSAPSRDGIAELEEYWFPSNLNLGNVDEQDTSARAGPSRTSGDAERGIAEGRSAGGGTEPDGEDAEGFPGDSTTSGEEFASEMGFVDLPWAITGDQSTTLDEYKPLNVDDVVSTISIQTRLLKKERHMTINNTNLVQVGVPENISELFPSINDQSSDDHSVRVIREFQWLPQNQGFVSTMFSIEDSGRVEAAPEMSLPPSTVGENGSGAVEGELDTKELKKVKTNQGDQVKVIKESEGQPGKCDCYFEPVIEVEDMVVNVKKGEYATSPPNLPMSLGLKVTPATYSPKAKTELTMKFKKPTALESGDRVGVCPPNEPPEPQKVICKITDNQLEAMRTQAGQPLLQVTVPWGADDEQTSCICGAHNKFELVTKALERGIKPLRKELEEIKHRIRDIDMPELDAFREPRHDSAAMIQQQFIYQEEITVQALPSRPCPYAYASPPEPQQTCSCSPPTPPPSTTTCSCNGHSEEPENLNTQMYTPPQQETVPAMGTAQSQSNRRVFLPGVNLYSNTSYTGYQNQDQPPVLYSRIAREVLTLPGLGIYVVPPEQPEYNQPSRMSNYGVRQQDNNAQYERRGSQQARQVFQPEPSGMPYERSRQQSICYCGSNDDQGEMYDNPATRTSPLAQMYVDLARPEKTARSSMGYSSALPQQSENQDYFYDSNETITCQCQNVGMQPDAYDERYQMAEKEPVAQGDNLSVLDIPSEGEEMVPASPPEGDPRLRSLPPVTQPLDGPGQSIWCDPEDIKGSIDPNKIKIKLMGSSLKNTPVGPACPCRDTNAMLLMTNKVDFTTCKNRSCRKVSWKD